MADLHNEAPEASRELRAELLRILLQNGSAQLKSLQKNIQILVFGFY